MLVSGFETTRQMFVIPLLLLRSRYEYLFGSGEQNPPDTPTSLYVNLMEKIDVVEFDSVVIFGQSLLDSEISLDGSSEEVYNTPLSNYDTV